jgi:hypothetical protein
MRHRTTAFLTALAATAALASCGHSDAAQPSAAPSETPASTPANASSAPATSLSAKQTCAEVAHPFAPTSIAIPGVTRGATVLAPPRETNGVPGTPPLTSEGKLEFAWDRAQGIRPGDAHGNVLLNAHTWPDGSALGNRMLAGLHEGDRIMVRGRTGRLCYRVTERVEVAASDGLVRYYARRGRPQLAIVVCSGRRLGPGEWENRTIWFASPHV